MYLDATPSFEADYFIMNLHQFVSRRGPPKEIWSDRGTNSVGANREFKESIARWNEEKIDPQLQPEVYQVGRSASRFPLPPPPPICAEFGNVPVQITENNLKSAVAEGLLSDTELRTMLAEVESRANSRPITAVSDDLEDCSARTPSHFFL